jgi:hypothetical protein
MSRILHAPFAAARELMNRALRRVRAAAHRSGPPFEHRVRLLSSRFRFADRRVLFGTARLYGDRIELASWNLHGRRQRRIPLDAIVHLDYHALSGGSNLSLYLETGEELHLQVEDAHVWREYFENWLRYNVLPSAKLLDDSDEAFTLSG